MALAAFNTMTAIKKKMHTMKECKEGAFDKADQLEQKLIEHRAISEKVRLVRFPAVFYGLNVRKVAYRVSQKEPFLNV